MSLKDAAPQGRLAGLRALRDRLAEEIDQCESSRDVAALANRFTDVLAQIDELDPVVVAKTKTPLDELNARRKAKAG